MSVNPEIATRKTLRYVDDRLASASFLRRTFNKVFPDHWSFMLGEIALYSFIILILTGTFLAFFFHASTSELVYNGSYVPLKGVEMSEAYASTLHISFDVRAGLLIRQIHHWAALLFVASIVVHLCRGFFTGAFRKPREINWVIGTALLTLGILEGFAGYSLPDDLLSGTGIRIGFSVLESIPLVGEYAAFLLFGGNYPGQEFFPRLFIAHVFLLPGIIAGLIGAHLMILWHQKHTDFPGPGKTEHNVIGSRLWPTYALKGQGFFFLTFAVLAALGAFFQINPIWLWGPYKLSNVSMLAQPDWYMGFLEGALRIFPNLESQFLGVTIPWNVFLPSIVLPGLLFTLLGVYPWLEKWWTGDKGYHHVLDRPRDNPTRVGIGCMALSFYVLLFAAGGNDAIAATFSLSVNAVTWFFRGAVFIVPPIAFYFGKRIALGLQHSDRELLAHGKETGIIRRLPSGEYIEITTPISDHARAVIERRPMIEEPAPDTGHPRPTRGSQAYPRGGMVATAQRRLSDFFVERRTRALPPGRPTDGNGHGNGHGPNGDPDAGEPLRNPSE